MFEKGEVNSKQYATIPVKARASACGKAIIVGEHAVVYGAKAVAMPLPQIRMDAELCPTLITEQNLVLSLKLGQIELSHHGRGVIKDAFRLLGISPFSLNISGRSSIPIGAGMGSSATLSVVVLRLLAKSLRIEITTEQLASFAKQLDIRFHGTPSGIDTTVVAHEDCILFSTLNPVTLINRTIKSTKPLHFALIDSNLRASTLTMIRIAEPYFRGTSGARRLQLFDGLASRVEKDLVTSNALGIADAMREAASLLAKIGVVNEHLASIIDICYQKGVLAAKTTGAGGGGIVIALLDPKLAQAQLSALESEFGSGQVFCVTI